MNYYQNNLILREALQSISRLKRSHMEDLKMIAEIEQKLSSILNNTIFKNSLALSLHDSSSQQFIAISNGHKLSENDFKSINEDDFDIILDLVKNNLRYRKDPANHSRLEISTLIGVGARRIEILRYLLEHPQRIISVENVSWLPKQAEIVEPTALAKSISQLRKALGYRGLQNPYIITERSLESTYNVYKINPEWHYLVIKEKM